MRVFLAAAIALVCGPLLTVNAEAADRRMKVINKSDYPMIKFQASNTKRKSWEEDILGDKTLLPGQSVVVNLDDGSGSCMFDLRAVFEGNRKAEKRNVNVCTTTSWTIN